MKKIERWGVFELVFGDINVAEPFEEADLSAIFTHGHRSIQVRGFYDGEGTYKIRFMPDEAGEWKYNTSSNIPGLHNRSGSFECVPATGDNHGVVRVKDRYHFAYDDGTPYVPVGTTCYAWNHQTQELMDQTIETLKKSPFNKMRMCVFPKHYDYNANEPLYHAFETNSYGTLNFRRFNPVFFRQLEECIKRLASLNIEVDLILFHPYDRWGYAEMDPETDDRYLRYIVSRLSAYRNIWWSLANEFDLMKKSITDWDRFFRIIQENDPWQHLRSIHNCRGFYDHNKPWVTHCSIQHSNLSAVSEWLETYRKPVVVDECCYEGNISHHWGNITAQEMTYRFWEGFTRGGFVGHGETYVHPGDVLWWAKGGKLYGESPERIAFLKEVLEKYDMTDAVPVPERTYGRDTLSAKVNKKGTILAYYGITRPAYKDVVLPEGNSYKADVIDTWEMTITPVEGVFSGSARIPMPNKQYIALAMSKI